MDEAEAEAASATRKFPVDEKVGTPPEPAPPSEPDQQGSGNPETMRESPTTKATTASDKPGASGNA